MLGTVAALMASISAFSQMRTNNLAIAALVISSLEALCLLAFGFWMYF